MTTPLVSILIVARNAAPFIDAAILSACEQTLTDIEIVVVDDGSVDGTAQIVRAHVDRDPRVRLLEGPRKGLSAVRNASLNAARGRFAAILDADDILHPRHLEWLVSSQAQSGAEVCATNMVEFREEGVAFKTRAFAQGRRWRNTQVIQAAEFVSHGMIGGKSASLGYLKPLFDINFLRAHDMKYKERLRIGEDFDIVLRALLAGARYLYLPQTTYYYRKHAGSISHRLAHADLEELLLATRAYPKAGEVLAAQLQARCDNLEGALLHLDVVAALKSRRLLHALWLTSTHRDARRLTLASLYEAVGKRIVQAVARRKPARTSALAHDESPVDRLRAIAQAVQPFVLSP
ncbi:glycosyltransferase family 2 protein [Novosphingobium sp. BL-52-GroH]|uniref:glycosyltransferase family 2 protein n=1 Tax=Novosphingobium sp. BL-52-GroH TaxID=3349877 RepID=UPI00384C104C